MPDGTSMVKMLKDQEEMLKKFLNENSNNIELKTATEAETGKKKK